MPEERLHHISKKRRFTLLLIPDDDAGTTRKIRFAPWQVVGGATLIVAFIIAAVVSLLVFTPVGVLIPIPNAELERRYGQELLALNQRLTTMAEQLVELRAYNLKLRKALGEKVVETDTGAAIAGTVRQRDESRRAADESVARRRPVFDEPLLKEIPRSAAVPVSASVPSVVPFPAILPAEGYVTRGFLPQERHYGIDIAGKVGSPVVAAADGHVVFVGWTNDDGNVVILAHAAGFVTFYKHNQTLLRSAGEFVKRGEVIALLGNSGRTSSGPHVHFEIWKDGVVQDPAQYVLNLNF